MQSARKAPCLRSSQRGAVSGHGKRPSRRSAAVHPGSLPTPRSGFLCEARSAEALYDAMKKFCVLDAPSRAAMGEQGRRIVKETFDIEVVCEIYRRTVDRYIKKGDRQ